MVTFFESITFHGGSETAIIESVVPDFEEVSDYTSGRQAEKRLSVWSGSGHQCLATAFDRPSPVKLNQDPSSCSASSGTTSKRAARATFLSSDNDVHACYVQSFL